MAIRGSGCLLLGLMRVGVLVPAFNEEGRVGNVVRDVRRHWPDAEIVVIDDGSRDGTGHEAREAGAVVLPLPVNSGYGAALQAGYRLAMRRGYELVAQIDGDGQHEAASLGVMFAAMQSEDADVVIGSRFASGDGHYRAPLARRVGIVLFAALASRITGKRVTDPTSGLQLLRRPVVALYCTDVYPQDYPDTDVLVLLHREGFRVVEAPVRMHPASNESMHRGHRSVYYVYKVLLSILLTLVRPRIAGPENPRQ